MERLYVGYRVELQECEAIIYLYEDPIFSFLKSIEGLMVSRRFIHDRFHDSFEYAAWASGQYFPPMNGLEVMLRVQRYSKHYNAKHLHTIESIVGPSWYWMMRLQEEEAPTYRFFSAFYEKEKHPEPWILQRR